MRYRRRNHIVFRERAQPGGMKAVFHLSTADPERLRQAVGNVDNLLADDTIDLDAIALVANSGGLDLLVEGSPVPDMVRSLPERGVALKACGNTLDGRDSADELLPGVNVVPSAMGELVRLQADGYAYIKP